MNFILEKLSIQPESIINRSNVTILSYNSIGLSVHVESDKIIIKYPDGNIEKIKPTDCEYINSVLEDFSNAS